MWRYKIAFTNDSSRYTAAEELSLLDVNIYLQDHYIIIECNDSKWDIIMSILDKIGGYSLFREYYD